MFFLIILVLSSAQGYRCCSGFRNIFFMPYHFLSLSLSPSHGLSLSLSFEEQALSISDIFFSQGKDIVLCPIPNQTHVCLLSVTFLSPPVITMYHNPHVCSSHSFSKNKKDGIFHGYRTDNTQCYVVCKSERVFSTCLHEHEKLKVTLTGWLLSMRGHLCLCAVQMHLCRVELNLSLQSLSSCLPAYCCKGTISQCLLPLKHSCSYFPTFCFKSICVMFLKIQMREILQ